MVEFSWECDGVTYHMLLMLFPIYDIFHHVKLCSCFKFRITHILNIYVDKLGIFIAHLTTFYRCFFLECAHPPIFSWVRHCVLVAVFYMYEVGCCNHNNLDMGMDPFFSVL